MARVGAARPLAGARTGPAGPGGSAAGRAVAGGPAAGRVAAGRAGAPALRRRGPSAAARRSCSANSSPRAPSTRSVCAAATGRCVDQARGDAQAVADALVVSGHEPPRPQLAGEPQRGILVAGTLLPPEAAATAALAAVDARSRTSSPCSRRRSAASVDRDAATDPPVRRRPAQVRERHDADRGAAERRGRRAGGLAGTDAARRQHHGQDAGAGCPRGGVR